MEIQNKYEYERVPMSDIETATCCPCTPHKTLRMTKKGRELILSALYFTFLFVLVLNFVFTLPGWGVMLEKYNLAKQSCNQKVDAIVIDQSYSSFYDECDIKLEWKRQNETQYTILKGYDCDPYAQLNTIFPKDTCYKKGQSELHVFPRGDAVIYSDSDIEYYYKTFIKLFCVWIISAVPMAGYIIMYFSSKLIENCKQSFEYK